MISKFNKHPRAGVWKRTAAVLLLVTLMVPAMGVAPMQAATVHAHPALLQEATRHPDSKVSVIVQKSVSGNSIEQAVVKLGGTVTKDLHIINAFAAELPAKAVPQLASMPGVRWVSPDAPIIKADCNTCVDTSHLQSAYIRAIYADRVWNTYPYVQGQNVAVAVVDTGVTMKDDFRASSGSSRIITSTSFISSTTGAADGYGHGTHVAGIIGGNGRSESGAYIGVAPRVNLVNLRVGDSTGSANASDVVMGLQWIYTNKSAYNIRAVNLSLGTTVPESYMTSPLDAAVEILWFSGVVVVASAGNTGDATGVQSAPANDPFVITVGATDDHGTSGLSDDTLAPYSSHGTTLDGFAKPEMVAPGTNIVSLLASQSEPLVQGHQDHIVDESYLRLSGTSMAAAVTSGAVALLLQDEPNLNPDQVKYRLMSTAIRGGRWTGNYLNAANVVFGSTTATANTGIVASQLLWTGNQPINWSSVNWGSVNWGSVNWGSVNWGSVNWGSVNWGSVYWNN